MTVTIILHLRSGGGTADCGQAHRTGGPTVKKIAKKMIGIMTAASLLCTGIPACAVYADDVQTDEREVYAAGVLKYILSGEGLTEAELSEADYNTDGEIDLKDVVLILNYSPVDTSDGVVVKDFSKLKSEIAKGGTVYVEGTIECDSQLKLTGKGAKIVGLTGKDGTGACLDFAKFRDTRTSAGSGNTGIVISGTGYDFSNLFIQNAGDCGVRINASSGGNCTFTNCVFRYNNNSGVSVTKGGHDNKFINCDSYRNGDIVQKNGDDADGYSVKLSAGKGNYFYNCRAWENSDDGWDSYDSGTLVPDVTYIECLAWHNGNPETFTGEYDYENGYPLDKNLIYVKTILKEDPDFEAKYNAHTVGEWPQVEMSLLGSKNTYSNMYKNWGGNPNGFKMGSSASDSSEYRYIENCIAFDHYGNANKAVQYRAKGFDQNGAKGMHYDLKNILSFNNVENIQMNNMVADSISGVVWSFDNCIGPDNNMYPDEPSSGMTVTEPENKDELRSKVYAYREMIYDYVYNNKIPGEQICDVFG